jgi:hypothetical protein
MPEGPAELELEVSPDLEKYVATLVQREGEAVRELVTRWQESIAEQTFTIALRRRGSVIPERVATRGTFDYC